MAATVSERRGRFVSLRVKLLVLFTLLFTLIFAATFYWFYNFATTMALSRIGEDLKDTLLSAAAGVDGDELQALYQEGTPREDGYTDDPRYWRQVEWFETVQHIEPRGVLYTYIEGENPGDLIFVTSGGARFEPEPFGATFLLSCTPAPDDCGDTSTNIAALTSAEPILEMEPYTDAFGSWVSGYTSVKNSEGEVVAGLGMDFRADYVFQVQQAIRNSMVMAFAVTYFVLFSLVFLLSKVLTGPISTLTHAAERIGEGDYEQDIAHLVSDRMPDEIDILAQVFAGMVNKVHQREKTLRRHVEELKIEIDEAKRERQVSEIVDTDFFQDLQAKADLMRTREQRPRRTRRATRSVDELLEASTDTPASDPLQDDAS
ncbi:MAG: HAMP domain-containing protein [Ardenticatenales bacterium]|nr:HAMP domain-containing protein [Ardenticatenales bacterium]